MIYIMLHKKSILPKNDFAVLQVGANGSEDLGYYKDDVNDNISNLNPYFCELTGIYWIWKNAIEDYVGICHYRRFFSDKNKILDEEEIRFALDGQDLILPKIEHFAVSVYKQYEYSNMHNISDLDKLTEVVKRKYPDYSDAFDDVMRGKEFYPYNMMYMRRELYNRYCTWLFNILFELMEQIPYEEYSGQKKRVFGYLSERMMLVWVRKNHLRVKELNVINTEVKTHLKEKIFTRINTYAMVYLGIDLRKEKN